MTNKITISHLDLVDRRVDFERINQQLNGSLIKYSSLDYTLFEGELEPQMSLFIQFLPETKAEFIIGLHYQSSKQVNIRINTELGVKTGFIEKQSKAGFLFLGADLGVDFMLPAVSKVSFQLILFPKGEFTKYFKDISTNVKGNIDFMIQHYLPMFYFSKNVQMCFVINSLITELQKRDFIVNLLIKLQEGNNNELGDDEVSFVDFCQILRVENYLRTSCSTQSNLSQKVEQDLAIPFKLYGNTFKKVFNKSLEEYHQTVLMEYAKILLKTENSKSIAEISEQLGYKKPKLFWQSFKRKFLISPEKYRIYG